ncbi:BMP family protein [Nakamurella lactea]|uniref:BMP family protein n=1 Tax=Nakamurella lactea TaxID=459515 RepID=UPI00040155B7|nr:BMP family protein [Nakamurella lactea]
MTRVSRVVITALAATAALFVSSCGSSDPAADGSGGASTAATSAASPAGSAAGSESSAAAATSGGGSSAAGASADLSGQKIAAVFSGPITDADYNALGFQALEAAKAEGAETSYSESVAVADVERALGEYVADGNTVVWTHGSQFYDATAKAAQDNPDVTFIGEFDGKPENQPANLWVIDRNFHLGFYAVGVLASKLSKSGTVGYVGGLSLPFSYSEVHAMEQAIKDLGAATTIKPVWTGDFNDAQKAQQISTQLLGGGADVLVGSLNLGAVGVFQAAQSKPAGEAWVTAKYTDKSSFGKEHYAGSVIYDFTGPLVDILAKTVGGERTGYYPLGFDTGVTVQVPDGVSQDVRTAVTEAMDKVKSGEVEVARNTEPIK